VTPDVTILDVGTLEVKSTTPGHRPEGEDAPALTPEQVREVAELGQRIEAHFGVPCDIEWGLADGEFVLLQSRPIRGLDVLRDVEVGRREEIERLRTLADGKRVVWVEHNLAETLPHPTPLTWDIVRHFMSGSGGYGRMYRDFGWRPSAEVEEQGFLELICGRTFVDPRRAAGLFWRGVPFEYDVDAVAADPSVLASVPRSLNMSEAGPAFCLRLPGLVWGMLRSARTQRRAREESVEAFEQRAVPQLQSFLDEMRDTGLRAVATPELVDELHRRRAFVLDEFGKESLKPGYFGGMAQGALLTLLEQLFGEEEGADLTRRLTSGLDHDTTVEQSILLDRVARGEATMDEFLDHFGHRCAGEMELAEPRWREDPGALEHLVASARRSDVESSEDRHARQASARREAEARLPGLLAERGGASLLERIEPELRDAQRLLPYRETGKHWLMLGYETIRAVLVELGRRWELGRDVFFLHLEELGAFETDRERLESAIAQRKVRWRSAQRLSVAQVVDSERLEELGRPRPVDGDALCGKALASGAARGVARIVRDPQEAGDLGTGYILVCPSTDPGWTPLFVHARGLVVERGGLLSHGAIVARDFGIPAVACEGATSAIEDGAIIAIDGTHGTVAMVEGRA
jgi:pyruvate,water dikinase